MTNKVNKEIVSSYDDFLDYYLLLNEKTREVYVREASLLLSYIEEKDLVLDTLTIVDLEEYIAFRTQDLKTATINKIYSGLKSFYKYLIKEEIVEENISLFLINKRNEKRIVKVLSEENVNSILDEFNKDTVLGLRDYAFFELIYSAGLRISEALNLKLNAYNRSEKFIIVIGKRNKERISYLNEIAQKALNDYIDTARVQLLSANKSPSREDVTSVFLSRYGAKISRIAMYKRYKAIVKDLSLEATVHTLRHSYASHLLSNGANIRQIQVLLGHQDIKTSQIYTHVDTAKLLDQFDEYSLLD